MSHRMVSIGEIFGDTMCLALLQDMMHTFADAVSCCLISRGTAMAARRSPGAMSVPPCGFKAAAARTTSAATSLRSTCRFRVASTDPEPCRITPQSSTTESGDQVLRSKIDTTGWSGRACMQFLVNHTLLYLE